MKILSGIGSLLILLGAASGPSAEESRFPPKASAEEVRNLIDRVSVSHPRLLLGADEARQLRGRVEADVELAAIAAVVCRDADAMLAVPPVPRELEGRRLLGQSRRAVRRILTLAMAHLLTGQEQYVARAATEMRAIAAFSDWNPAHYLDVAEMTFAMAIGYDWLFDSLDEKTRAAVREAILTKGVRVPLGKKNNGWTRATNNWGQVCHAGMVAGALAVLESDRDAAASTIHRAIANVPRSMASYAPRGSYPEGPSYWSYGTTYNVLLLALLESVLETDFGLEQAPGFDQTGAYPALMTGPSGYAFNYADGGFRRGVEPAVHWFASHFHRPDWRIGEKESLQQRLSEKTDPTSDSGRFFPLLLLWAKEGFATGAVHLPLHWTSGDATPVAVHRSGWERDDAVFAGLKGGSPSGPHGHMDIGSFVLDADGVRWAADLGAEKYHRIESRGMNFWSMKQDSDRWRVFRQSSLSHNTLVIGGALQRAAGHAGIVRFSASPEFPHSVVDMSDVYVGQAESVHRGIALLPSGEVLVRDHLTGLKPGVSVRWGMVTPATPGETGASTLDLRQAHARLALRILQPAGATWEILDTATPRNEWDSPNPGTAMAAFTVTAPATGILDLAVVFIPGSRTATPTENLNLAPPLEWSDASASQTTPPPQ